MFEKIKVRFVTMLTALGILAAAPALTGCGTDYENEATKKAIDILEDATKDPKHMGDEIERAQKLAEHVGNLPEDQQDQGLVIADETLKVLNNAQIVVDYGTALSTSGNNLVSDTYNARKAQKSLDLLVGGVQTVQGWSQQPEYVQYSVAYKDLFNATCNAMGLDPTAVLNGTQKIKANNGQEIESAAEGVGYGAGVIWGELLNGFDEGMNDVRKFNNASDEAEKDARMQDANNKKAEEDYLQGN